MKKCLALMLAAALALSLAACGGSGQGRESDPPGSPSQAADRTSEPAIPTPSATPAPATAPVEQLEGSGTLGDYAAEIHGFELSEDYSGAPAILVSYTFTNNAEEAASGMVSLSATAYQNGVQLETAIVSEQDIGADQMKEIKQGASIELSSAFVLLSETAPVEFELSEAFSFSEEKLGKTFQISQGGVTVLSVAPTGDVSGDLGDHTVSVVSHKLSKDYQGAAAIVVSLGFTNNGTDTDNFLGSISCKAFQDGVELETAILSDEDSGNGESQLKNVRPGAGIEVSVAYVLTSDTSPVELELEELFGFSDDKIETSIDLTA